MGPSATVRSRCPGNQAEHTAPARRTICREQDLHNAVPIICSGGPGSDRHPSRRQPADTVLPSAGRHRVDGAAVRGPSDCLVEAITEVRYRSWKRKELRQLLFAQPNLMEKLSKVWIDEKSRADQLIVDLGRRTADERIARLILNLVDRLGKRDMVHGNPMEVEFPLRQHHIADATGLTPVHVSKVLSEFRRSGLIKISERSLSILHTSRASGASPICADRGVCANGRPSRTRAGAGSGSFKY